MDGSASRSGDTGRRVILPSLTIKEVDLMIDIFIKVIELATKVVGLISSVSSFIKNRPSSDRH